MPDLRLALPLVTALVLSTGCRIEPDPGKKVNDSGVTSGTAVGTTGSGFPSLDQQIDGAEDLTPNPESNGVQMCALDGGELVVVWSDDRAGDHRGIWATVSTDGGQTWPDSPVQVNDGVNHAENPSVGCSGSTILLAWEDQRDSEIEQPNVYFSRSTDLGQTWSANVRLGGQDEGVFAMEEPTLAVNGSNVHVAWSSDENGAPDIYVASSSNSGQSFDPPVRIDGGTAGSSWSKHPSAAAGPNGQLVVAWEDRRNGNTDIWVAHSSNGGSSFGAAARVDNGTGNSFAPAVAVGGGQAYVAWHDDRDGVGLEVYAAHSANGGSSFSGAFRMSEGTPGDRDSILPQLVLAGNVLHATWFQGMLGGYHVVYKRVQDGTELGPQTRIDHAPDTAQTVYPRLAVDGDNVVVAWRDDRDTTVEDRDDLYYNYSADGGATWSAEDYRIDSHDAGSTWTDELNLLLDSNGLSASWTDGRSGSSDVWFIHLQLGDASG